MMRAAFTIIELLVVLTIITLVMGLVVPKGSKMLKSYENSIKKIERDQQLSKAKAKAFLQATEIEVNIDMSVYCISKKGILFEKSCNYY